MGAADGSEHCLPSSASCPPGPALNGGRAREHVRERVGGRVGSRGPAPMLGSLQHLAGLAISCDMLRSLLFLSPVGSGRKVVVILPGGGCLAEVRSGVSGDGQVQRVLTWFRGQGRVGSVPPSPTLWVPGGTGRSLLVRERFEDLGGPSCLGVRFIGNLCCTSPPGPAAQSRAPQEGLESPLSHPWACSHWWTPELPGVWSGRVIGSGWCPCCAG